MFLLPGLQQLLREGPGKQGGSWKGRGPGPIQPSMLVLAPTRELATQIHEAAVSMTAATPLKVCSCLGLPSTP